MAFLTRTFTVWLALACLLGFPVIGRAEYSLSDARVVLVRWDRVYVASGEAVAIEAGMILTFTDRGKKVATAEVTAVHNGELIEASVTLGSLAKVKHFEKLQVTADRPAFPMPLLRIGYPAAGRKNLLFDCSYQSLDSSRKASSPSPLQWIYRLGEWNSRGYLLVRDSTHLSAVSWPESLLVHQFDEVADEEIALERGDLDAAVFWPGEASAHIREVMGWKWRSGTRSHGRLTATPWREGLTRDAIGLRDDEWKAIELLNQELFRGDLLPAQGWKKPLVSTPPGRFEVDPSFPGRETMERFLNRAMGASAPIDSARVIRVYYTPGWFILGDLPPETRVLVRCPVISGPKLRPYLDVIDLGNLFQCEPSPRKP